jgi:hypothetical protein
MERSGDRSDSQVPAAHMDQASVRLTDERGRAVQAAADARDADIDLLGKRVPADDMVFRLCSVGQLCCGE